MKFIKKAERLVWTGLFWAIVGTGTWLYLIDPMLRRLRLNPRAIWAWIVG